MSKKSLWGSKIFLLLKSFQKALNESLVKLHMILKLHDLYVNEAIPLIPCSFQCVLIDLKKTNSCLFLQLAHTHLSLYGTQN